tara:strand:- start:60 stop:3962 length:3903 start_codon:yes stop_codon:yes gene_type:complete
MAENNSLQTILPELLRLFNNSLENFEKVNEAITSSRKSVTINVQGGDGINSRVTIPSFGFLKNSIERLDNNIQTITNFNGGDSSIRLSDGTFRKLVLAKLPTEASDVTSLNSINTFGVKPNWFFEELINPLLFVSFDITGQAPIDTERAIIKRFILNTNTQSKINFYKDQYDGRSDIDYNTFLREIVEKNITYVLDEAVVDLPPRVKRYSGKFGVLRISDADITEEINGVSVTTTKKLYKLNKIFYTDAEADFEDTIQLKVGDSLEVVSAPIDTRYKVTQVDTSANTVVLELVEGLKPVRIGSDVLKISSALEDNVQVDVTVGFNERCVTFIKPIDPDSKIPSVNWSPGSAFYTNGLTTVDSNGNQQTLAAYYQQQAIDFGRFLLSFAEDKIPTSREGVTPNSPVLEPTDFSVKLVNKQVAESPAVVELVDLSNQKNTLESDLKELDSAISQSRTKIQTTNFATEVERDAEKNSLNGLITERGSQAKLYSSVVTEIDAKAQSNSVLSITPKYRVRGFWPMPEEKSAPSTGSQAIVKFQVRYRYLSSDGAANPVDTFSFTDGERKSQGAFSNYVLQDSDLRPRTKNPITGLFEWATITTDNADDININQLDIPIRKGEQVEIQVRSISEAGWPSNPLISEYSDPVIIGFPEDLSSDNAVESIIAQNAEDRARVALEEDLNAKGLDTHLSSSFTANETYYAHSTPVIASGFLSENQTPIDLFTKLQEMQARLDQFAEILNSARGELSVRLVDDKGNDIRIKRNTLTKVFAGFYTQEVATLEDPRGAIISKTFFINIGNRAQTPLQLVARISGNRSKMVRQSENPLLNQVDVQSGATILPATYSWLNNSAVNQSDGLATYKADDADYNTTRKYDLTPIVLSNPTITGSWQYGQRSSLAPYQSSQNKNQFIYSRFSDVSSEDNFYSYRTPDDLFSINLDSVENFYGRDTDTNLVTAGEFIWGGGFDASGLPTTATDYVLPAGDNTLGVHITHPFVVSYAAYKAAYGRLTGDTSNTILPDTTAIPGGGVDCTSAGNGTADVMFRHSKFIPFTSGSTYGKQQAIYLNERVLDMAALSTQIGIATLDPNGPGSQNIEASPSYAAIAPLGQTPTTATTVNGGIGFERNTKTSFESTDQYLLGKQTTGSYLFISSDDHENIQVNGDATQSIKAVAFGQQNSLNIPLVFQYRMTDYFGAGAGSAGGLGNVAGDSTGGTVNLTYAKKIGFDIYPNGDDVVQFDIEVFAKYRSDNLNVDVFPQATVSKGLRDLEQVIGNLRPNVGTTNINDQINFDGIRVDKGLTDADGNFL